MFEVSEGGAEHRLVAPALDERQKFFAAEQLARRY
jgi:hypothetical protein